MSAPEHLWQLGVEQSVRAYTSGQATPTSVLASVLERISAVNPLVNAIAHLDAEGAFQAASASEARYRANAPLGPLDGVVISVKDNITVAGLPCRWGTELFRDFVPTRDETPVARLRAAGAIIVAKTTVSEFSNGRGIVSTPLFGTTRNPWNLGLTTGSSSGGAAAAVATGMGAAALATDGGGSIRIPASHCGLFGLKPSVGQVPRSHGLPVIMNGQEVAGPIGRSPRDLDLMMRVIAGPDDEDAASWPASAWPNDDLSADVEPCRILHVSGFGAQEVASEVVSQSTRAAARLCDLGHRIEAGELPFSPADIAAARTVTRAGMAWLLRDKDWRNRTDPYYELVAEAGAKLSATDYVEATASARRVQAAAGLLFRSYDLVLSPVCVMLPGPADVAVQRDYTTFTSFANVAGLPSVSIPAGMTHDGTPVGFQLTGRFGSDRLLLRVAAQYEASRDFVGDSSLLNAPINRIRISPS